MFDQEIIDALKKILIDRQETLAVAESVTSGFLQAALSTTEDASRFYQGGITVYNLGQKFRHLNVEPIHAAAVNCVSEKVSGEMALHCSKLFNSHWSIGITGYSSPVPESGNKMFAYYAIARQDQVLIEKRIDSDRKPGMDTQLLYVNDSLRTLHDYMQQEKNTD